MIQQMKKIESRDSNRSLHTHVHIRIIPDGLLPLQGAPLSIQHHPSIYFLSNSTSEFLNLRHHSHVTGSINTVVKVTAGPKTKWIQESDRQSVGTTDIQRGNQLQPDTKDSTSGSLVDSQWWNLIGSYWYKKTKQNALLNHSQTFLNDPLNLRENTMKQQKPVTNATFNLVSCLDFKEGFDHAMQQKYWLSVSF